MKQTVFLLLTITFFPLMLECVTAHALMGIGSMRLWHDCDDLVNQLSHKTSNFKYYQQEGFKNKKVISSLIAKN